MNIEIPSTEQKILSTEKDPKIIEETIIRSINNFRNKKKIQKFLIAINRFKNENGREPTALDFDSTDYLPSSRSIQRLYGGLKAFRTEHNMETVDFTKGDARRIKATKSTADATKIETELFIRLIAKYGQNKVSSPSKVFQWSNITADFRIYHRNKTYLVDVFMPNSKHSFAGCVRSKNAKYLQPLDSFYLNPVEILYVCLNESVMYNIKNPVPILTFKQFEKKFL